ncbi:MAG: endonuclease VIII [Planctomycetes bacterium]|nr:endonuclease VIII [Planctomycetota bacterium]
MPEGPEIRREADRIGRQLRGARAEAVWFAFSHLQEWSALLRGVEIRTVESRAKAMLIRFASGVNIYSHNQLYGRWFVVKRGDMPRTDRQLRLAVHTATHSALLYSASEIEVLHDDDLPGHPFLARLGPDVLSEHVQPNDLEARLVDPRFRRRSLGALLLDQGFVSGLGNYLRSEILFVARLAPSLRPVDLLAHQRAELANAIAEIARRAYRHAGVTNEPAEVRRLKGDGCSRREYRHFVFGRGGKRCRRCDATIVRSEHSGRRLYACPSCQGVAGDSRT